MHVVTPIKDDQIYPAPYGEYDREEKEWKPTQSFLKTQNMLKDGAYSAADFVDGVNELYSKSKPFGKRASVN